MAGILWILVSLILRSDGSKAQRQKAQDAGFNDPLLGGAGVGF
jgi:hypothetical protein